jgi:hypothetical protein
MNIETIELDEATIGSLKNLTVLKQQHVDAIEHIDDVAQAVIRTVINVKGLAGDWSLTADMKLVKAPQYKPGHEAKIVPMNAKVEGADAE